MTTQTFISRWNKGNKRDKADLFVELDLDDKVVGIAAVRVHDENLDSLHFVAVPPLRAGIWYAKLKTGDKEPMEAFRLHSNPELTFASWQEVCNNPALSKSVKPFFIEGYSGIVQEEYTDN